jgi:hypothetical protein
MGRSDLLAGENMTVQTVKLAGKKFVIVAEKDYRNLQAQAAQARNGQSKTRRLTAQDRGDIAEAKRRANEPARPYSELRKELGLS